MVIRRHRQYILENVIFLILWLVAFLMPFFARTGEEGLEWDQIHRFWLRMLPFLVIFLINNYILVPYFLFRKKYWFYFLLLFATIAVVILPLHIHQSRRMPFPGEMTSMEQMQAPDGEQPGPPREFQPQGDRPFRPEGGREPNFRMPIRVAPLLSIIVIAILIVGFNLAIRFLFKSVRDQQQIKELERLGLEAELNYLKTQINPHFFMNTLNNIHALVDIDTERAKETVIELSKIMRYVLYDADRPVVPLSKEVQFIENYIRLMQIRFTDEVEIREEYPDPVPEVKIPPMMLITLVENAFKHGISYRRDSFIHTELTITDGRLRYAVANSTSDTPSQKPGVGMENLTKRLSLLFGSNYLLEVSSTMAQYRVTLEIPIEV